MDLREQLSKEIQDKIKELIDKGCTDSDIIDLCEENNISRKAAFHYIAELTAPQQCRGCKNIALRPSMPPSTSCRRNYTKDHYEPENL